MIARIFKSAMLFSSIWLHLGSDILADDKGYKYKQLSEEEREIIEMLDFLEEYEMLKIMDIVEGLNTKEDVDNGKNKHVEGGEK